MLFRSTHLASWALISRAWYPDATVVHLAQGIFLLMIVLQHPAWLAYPNIKSFELHPRLPICVGFWDGTTTGVAPNANPLQDSGIISDLLRLTDNPKGPNSTQTTLSNSKSSKTFGPISRMAITVHIRPLGEDSEDEDHNIQLRIKQDDNSSSLASLPPPAQLQQSPSIQQPQSDTQSSTLNTPISTSQSHPLPSNAQSLSPTGSTTQEDTPPPSYLPTTHPPSSTLGDSPSTSTIVNASSNRPATPITRLSSQSTLARKRSLTLLSPEQISTKTTRDIKRNPCSKNTSPITIPVLIVGDSVESSTSTESSIEIV